MELYFKVIAKMFIRHINIYILIYNEALLIVSIDLLRISMLVHPPVCLSVSEIYS